MVNRPTRSAPVRLPRASIGLVAAVACVDPGVGLAQTCAHPAGNVAFGMLGDLNDSGTVNVADALCAVMTALVVVTDPQAPSWPSCVAHAPTRADLDCSGQVDTGDVQLVIRLAHGSGLPHEVDPLGVGCAAACAPCVEAHERSCLIAGTCVPEGGLQTEGGCDVCAPDMDAAAFVAASDGTSCAEQSVCHGGQCGTYPPLAPRDVMASPIGAGALVAFTAPTSDGGLPITHYTARCVAEGQAPSEAAGAQSPLVVPALVEGAPYQCEVRAHNDVGEGLPGLASGAVVPTAPSSPSPAHSTLSSSAAEAAACGEEPVMVEVVARDADGVALPGVAVTLVASDPDGIGVHPTSGFTGADGALAFTVVGWAAGPAALYATVAETVELEQAVAFSVEAMAGSGTEEDPYQVASLCQLQALEQDLTAHYVLVQDIDATATASWFHGLGFRPIGDGWTGTHVPFTGSLDGQGHIITGLTIDRPNENFVGLFGRCICWIQDVGLEDVYVQGNGAVGGLAGGLTTNSGGSNSGDPTGFGVHGCHTTGHVRGTIWSIGGLVGRLSGQAPITHSFSTATVFQNHLSNPNATSLSGSDVGAGGLVGRIYGGSISDCYATGNVSRRNQVGGLVGNSEGGNITRSWASGHISTVSTSGAAGGLVGTLSGNFPSTITRCFATGDVNSYRSVGGLVGNSGRGGLIADCYATGDVTTSTFPSTGGVGGLIGQTSHHASWPIQLERSYATGKVVAAHPDRTPGGLIGLALAPAGVTVLDSFWDVETSLMTQSGLDGDGEPTDAGGTGKTTAEMKTLSTYLDVALSEGLDEPWDFVGQPGAEGIWDLDPAGVIAGGYPYLVSLPEP